MQTRYPILLPPYPSSKDIDCTRRRIMKRNGCNGVSGLRWGSDVPLHSIKALKSDLLIASKVYTKLLARSSNSGVNKSLALASFQQKHDLLNKFTLFEKKHCDPSAYASQ
mmetsp:Transcript_25250/g.42599  ORF Transcript_25250/g.42599 Transcript_25250/m.42599 type:complete len:110 (+) Transcript_25250:440-769(+)